MAEVSDAELTILRNAHGLLQRMDRDPKTKPLLERAIKVFHPEVVTAEESAQASFAPMLEPVTAAMTKIQERLDADAAERQAAVERQAEQSLESTFAGYQKAHGLTDEGVNSIKELMVKRHIADPEAALALWNQQNPKPVTEGAPAWQPEGWDLASAGNNVGGVRDLEGLMKDPDGWADKEAAIVMNEIRVGQAA